MGLMLERMRYPIHPCLMSLLKGKKTYLHHLYDIAVRMGGWKPCAYRVVNEYQSYYCMKIMTMYSERRRE